MTRKKSRKQSPPPSTIELTQSALERYQPLLSADDFSTLLKELAAPLIQALRVNPLKADAASAMLTWAKTYGWKTEQVPYCDHGWWIHSAETAISQTTEHRLGYYYIQDAASMLPVELFDISPEPSLTLDLAASPGGKTTHLLARTCDRGLVIANDSSRDRLTALRIVLGNWGAYGTAVTNFPGEKFGAWYPETFDRVLLDAPCSMENLRSTESHPMRPITARERANLAVRQARLLASALKAVKTGGQVVYSTCTLALEEDEAVLDAVLKQHPGLVQIDDISEKLPAPAPGLTANGQQHFDADVVHSARLWPHRYHTSGFFAARLTKLATIPAETEPPPARSLERIGWQELEPKDISRLAGTIIELYGFDLFSEILQASSSLWKFGSAVYAIPQAYLAHFSSLPAQGLGLFIGEDTLDGFALSHEVCSRYGTRFSNGTCILNDPLRDDWIKGRDVLSPSSGYPTGQIVVVLDADGRNLGRGRVALQTIKNLLPRRVL